jgi:hypothetical protein
MGGLGKAVKVFGGSQDFGKMLQVINREIGG